MSASPPTSDAWQVQRSPVPASSPRSLRIESPALVGQPDVMGMSVQRKACAVVTLTAQHRSLFREQDFQELHDTSGCSGVHVTSRGDGDFEVKVYGSAEARAAVCKELENRLNERIATTPVTMPVTMPAQTEAYGSLQHELSHLRGQLEAARASHTEAMAQEMAKRHELEASLERQAAETRRLAMAHEQAKRQELEALERQALEQARLEEQEAARQAAEARQLVLAQEQAKRNRAAQQAAPTFPASASVLPEASQVAPRVQEPVTAQEIVATKVEESPWGVLPQLMSALEPTAAKSDLPEEVHLVELRAGHESRLLALDANQFGEVMASSNPMAWELCRKYASAFVELLNQLCGQDLTDILQMLISPRHVIEAQENEEVIEESYRNSDRTDEGASGIMSWGVAHSVEMVGRIFRPSLGSSNASQAPASRA